MGTGAAAGFFFWREGGWWEEGTSKLSVAFPGSQSLSARHCARGLFAGPPAPALHAAAVKGRARGNRRARGPLGTGAGPQWQLRGMRGSARGFSNMAAAV